MLKLADLAARGDFDAGPLHVSPARRLIEGPSGSVTVEPIVMKVFLLLLDAAGNVVTRDELFGNAWGGVFVGDDSLNRAIARVRKIANETAPGLFEIETIPRTGYRLTGPIVEELGASAGRPSEDQFSVSRRAIVGAAAASLGVLAGGGWWWKRTNDESRFEDLLRRGREGMEYSDGSGEPTELLRQAVALRSTDATAQGLYAYSLVANADSVNRGDGGVEMQKADVAVNASLELDPNEPHAKLAQIQLERATLDLAGTESRIRSVLAAAPRNLFALQFLWNLLQSTGQSRAALTLVERSIAWKPRAPANHYPLAQLLWITGRTAEADRVIDRAMISWPEHRYVRFARFTIFAFTGRPRAALEMLENPQTRPQVYDPDSVALWRPSLAMLDHPSPGGVAKVRDAYISAVKEKPRLANQAVLVLSALGEVEAAFEMANKLLLFKTPGPGPQRTDRKWPGSTAWRFTPWLFTPPVSAMRADPRFGELCDGTGLTDYWRKRGIKPDYQLT